jgi:rod shape-determining protein MreB
MSGLPKTVILAPEEVREAIEEQSGAIVDAVLRCLGAAPPELSQDLLSQGLHLVGGGGMLKGLDRRLSEETGLPVALVEAPLECVVMGAGKCIENFDAVHDLLMT